jgi:hypothetical protein
MSLDIWNEKFIKAFVGGNFVIVEDVKKTP